MKTLDFSNYKFRSHAVGNIMGGIPSPLTENQKKTFEAYNLRFNGTGKPLTDKQAVTYGDLLNKKNSKLVLSQTAKSYLEKLVWENLTGRVQKINSKYIDKGLTAENDSINLYGKLCGKKLNKNTERKSNNYIEGECDLIDNDLVIDIKSSWDYTTFPLFSEKPTSKLYEWQLLAYMDLWNKKKSRLAYCLVDTPFNLIDDDLKRFSWKYDILDMSGNIRLEKMEIVRELITNNIFSKESLFKYLELSQYFSRIDIVQFKDFVGIPEAMRIKLFDFEFCEKKQKQMYQMIEIARSYMNDCLLELHEKFETTKSKLI